MNFTHHFLGLIRPFTIGNSKYCCDYNIELSILYSFFSDNSKICNYWKFNRPKYYINAYFK